MMNSLWYQDNPLRWLLLPFSALYALLMWGRRGYLQRFKQIECPVPLIVVGNITVGGAGKTPLIIALAKAFEAKGVRVGIVSRGYRAASDFFPREVHPDDQAVMVGDEPLLIHQETGCPVVISPRRVEAVQYLLKHHQPQVILSDDGLQHYAMGRAIEIAVIDGERGLGNGLTLPAGPLRERKSRLKTVDFIVVNSGHWPNSYSMNMVPLGIVSLRTGAFVKQTDIDQPVAAVAGIGNPKRFYTTLSEFNVAYTPYAFPDHHLFKLDDLLFKEKIIVMTAKDAVKCRDFAMNNLYFLSVTAELEPQFWAALWAHQQLKGVLPA